MTYDHAGEPVPDTERTILEEAGDIVKGARREGYGHPATNHARTARLWSAYLGFTVTRHDVCVLNILQKISRQKHKPGRDNLVDIAGYARCLEMMDVARCQYDEALNDDDPVSETEPEPDPGDVWEQWRREGAALKVHTTEGGYLRYIDLPVPVEVRLPEGSYATANSAGIDQEGNIQLFFWGPGVNGMKGWKTIDLATLPFSITDWLTGAGLLADSKKT